MYGKLERASEWAGGEADQRVKKKRSQGGGSPIGLGKRLRKKREERAEMNGREGEEA